jgi:hypothetical protein
MIGMPTTKKCGVCQQSITAGEAMIPLSGLGAQTVWAHKTCR